MSQAVDRLLVLERFRPAILDAFEQTQNAIGEPRMLIVHLLPPTMKSSYKEARSAGIRHIWRGAETEFLGIYSLSYG
jgi:hypothetical protein